MRTVAIMLALALSANAAAFDSEAVQKALSDSLPDFAVSALQRIPDNGRKLLAARSYLRSHASLQTHWSWDETQIAAFEGSVEQKALSAEIELITVHFAKANPGYTLYANMQVRSLDKQIASWNSNASVATSAAALLLALDAANPAPEKLKVWLSAYSPNPKPNLAAPGLSAHGQMHAIDFQIKKGGSLFATADSSKLESVWRAQGWDKKLSESIAESGASFHGPLTSPDEPWHYTYNSNKTEK